MDWGNIVNQHPKDKQNCFCDACWDVIGPDPNPHKFGLNTGGKSYDAMKRDHARAQYDIANAKPTMRISLGELIKGAKKMEDTQIEKQKLREPNDQKQDIPINNAQGNKRG